MSSTIGEKQNNNNSNNSNNNKTTELPTGSLLPSPAPAALSLNPISSFRTNGYISQCPPPTHVSSWNNTDFRMVRLVTIMKKKKNTEEQEG